MPGQGIRATVDAHEVLVNREGAFVNGRQAGTFEVSDPPRSNSFEAIAMLSHARIRVALLTGDRKSNADATASALGIQDVFAEMTPEGKLAEIERLQKAGHAVAMVGDGINDAPALARANVGIAMGGGSGIAIEAGDVTLLRADPRIVAEAIVLARRTWRIVMQNFVWALAYNVIAIPAAALGYLNPMIASAAMAMSSISVVMNSLRLRRHTTLT